MDRLATIRAVDRHQGPDCPAQPRRAVVTRKDSGVSGHLGVEVERPSLVGTIDVHTHPIARLERQRERTGARARTVSADRNRRSARTVSIHDIRWNEEPAITAGAKRNQCKQSDRRLHASQDPPVSRRPQGERMCRCRCDLVRGCALAQAANLIQFDVRMHRRAEQSQLGRRAAILRRTSKCQHE